MASSTRRRTVEFRLDPIDRCYDPRWFFGGEERTINKYRMLVIFLDDLEKCTATDLQAALRRARKLCGDLYYPLPVVILQDDFYDEVLATPEPIHFKMLDEDLTFSVSFGLDPRDVRDPPQLVGTVLQPLLQRQGMTIVDSGSHEGYPPETLIFVDVSIAFNTRGRTLRELYDLGNDAIALIDAIDSGQLTRKTAGDLIRAGHANVLIGQPERHWLDVKSQHYELSQLAGKIKLAQSASRFCNAEEGGLVVVGMATKKVPGGEEIRRLCPMPRDKAMLGRYQRALEDHLFPPPDNLRIETIDMPDNEMLILIDVPPQPEELKPFLVHGAVVDDKAEGASISITRRRGESSIPITAQAIHSTLAAGRALLRRGELPPDS